MTFVVHCRAMHNLVLYASVLFAKTYMLDWLITNVPGRVFIPEKAKADIIEVEREEICFIIRCIEDKKML